MPLYSDLNDKYDLFGLRIKSYHYVPSSDQTEKDAKSNNDNLKFDGSAENTEFLPDRPSQIQNDEDEGTGKSLSKGT